MIKSLFTFSLIFFLSLNYVKAKKYDGNSFICADEIGPKLEFTIPDFKDEKKSEEDFILKEYDTIKRERVISKRGIIKKKTSPIDYSYIFYQGVSIKNKNSSYDFNFEFFPPSHLIFEISNNQFIDFVCWTE